MFWGIHIYYRYETRFRPLLFLKAFRWVSQMLRFSRLCRKKDSESFRQRVPWAGSWQSPTATAPKRLPHQDSKPAKPVPEPNGAVKGRGTPVAWNHRTKGSSLGSCIKPPGTHEFLFRGPPRGHGPGRRSTSRGQGWIRYEMFGVTVAFFSCPDFFWF